MPKSFEQFQAHYRNLAYSAVPGPVRGAVHEELTSRNAGNVSVRDVDSGREMKVVQMAGLIDTVVLVKKSGTVSQSGGETYQAALVFDRAALASDSQDLHLTLVNAAPFVTHPRVLLGIEVDPLLEVYGDGFETLPISAGTSLPSSSNVGVI